MPRAKRKPLSLYQQAIFELENGDLATFRAKIRDPKWVASLGVNQQRDIGDAIVRTGDISLMLNMDVETCFKPLFSRWLHDIHGEDSHDLSRHISSDKVRKIPKDHPLRETATDHFSMSIRKGAYSHWENLREDPFVLKDLFPLVFADTSPGHEYRAGKAFYSLLGRAEDPKSAPADFLKFAKLEASKSKRWDARRWNPLVTQDMRFHSTQYDLPSYIHSAAEDDNAILLTRALRAFPQHEEYALSGLGLVDSILHFNAVDCFEAMVKADPEFFIKPRLYCQRLRTGYFRGEPGELLDADAIKDTLLHEDLTISKRRPFIDWASSTDNLHTASGGGIGFSEMKSKWPRNGFERLLEATLSMGQSLLAKKPKELSDWNKGFSSLKTSLFAEETTYSGISKSLLSLLEGLEKTIDPEPVELPSAKKARELNTKAQARRLSAKSRALP